MSAFIPESFGAKPFDHNEPDNTWELDRLSAYARQQHEEIVQNERASTMSYWRLGQCLSLARKQGIARGQWSRYLESLGVHKVRASRAKAIFRTFPTPEAVRKLGVEEAYGQRVKTQVASRRRNRREESCDEPTTLTKPDSLEVFFMETCQRAETLADVAAFADRDERIRLFPVLREAIQRLNELGRLLGLEDEINHAASLTGSRAAELPRSFSEPETERV